ncbi:MAG TPA: hypothetical protein VGB18_02860 [Candidatus Thermoplasmatota archaeon]
MNRTLLLAAVLIFAGCVEPVDANEQPATLVDPTTSPVANGTAEPVAPVVTVEVPFTETRGDAITLFINTTASVDIVVTLDGSETLREALTTSAERRVPLTFGGNIIGVAASAPGFSDDTQLSVVRLGKTTLNVDYGVFHPASQGTPRVETFEVWFDVDARPSEPAYAAQGIEHIDLFTAHDQLVVFEQVTGKKVVFEYFPSFQGYGVSRIDDAGSSINSDAPPWWCYTVNAASADGISIQPVVPGDVVLWKLGSCA